ncbi:hypothetical protein DXN04_15645 [Chitinophaga silvisoli]|uniref:Glycosyltransferase RgtA/B/C/D-like domain-containing protein n=2 Tax=Chitinophaga silvisoli TaxID=2291814 RepID=A0A3E1P3B6_9BACT|nr:hypothetical protein DXN04_15645 [Chitinophaga silvisoli]
MHSSNYKSPQISSTGIYSLVAIIISFSFWSLFKVYYPFPNLTFDSYYYIEAAVSNSAVSTWPVGYSKFIRLIGIFTHSGNVLVTIQYIILQFSFLFLFLSIYRLIVLKKWIFNLIFIFLFINPLFLFGSNHIMSDTLFTALSVLWVTQLIWIAYRPKPYMVFTHAILLLIIFTIRYSALYYPVISISIFLLSPQSFKWKLLGIVVMILFLLGFVQYTSYKMEVVTGSRQFSYTGGWKQANNALYMYEHAFRQNKGTVPDKFKVIDSISQSYFSKPHALVDLLEHMDVTTGTWYTSFDPSPLRQYMKVSKGIDPATSDFKKLAYFGPFYNDYGNYLIKKYPLTFIKYVVTPNIITYWFPILEIYDRHLLAFSLMDTEFGKMARQWFGLRTIAVPENLINLRAEILAPYGMVFTVVHILFLFTFVAFLLVKGYKGISKIYVTTVFMLAAICIVNFFFIILVAPSVLRFQLIVYILEFINALLIINVITSQDNLKKGC